MSAYLDPSVIVSLFINDSSSQRADRLLRKLDSEVFVSDFSAAEFSSAMSLRVRTKELTGAQARAALSDFDEWAARSTTRTSIASEDITAAESYLRRFDTALRTPDAIHLAIAGRVGARLATFDKKMAAAARTIGVDVVQT